MTDRWYFADRGKGFGPFSLQQLRLLLACGLLQPLDLIWQDGALESRPAKEIDDLVRQANDPEVKPRGRERLLWIAAACGLLLGVGMLFYAGKSLIGTRRASEIQVVEAGSNNDHLPDKSSERRDSRASTTSKDTPADSEAATPAPPKPLAQEEVGEVRCFRGHKNEIMCLAVSPDGSLVASGSKDKTVRLWETTTGKQVWEQKGFSYYVRAVAFSADGKKLFCCDSDRLTVRHAQTGEVEKSFNISKIEIAAFSKDCRRLVVIQPDQKGQVIDTETGEVVHRIASPSVISCAGFTNDGRSVIYGWAGLHVHDLQTGKTRQRQIFVPSSSYVHALAFSPDDKFLLTGSGKIWTQEKGDQMGDRLIRLWDARTGEEVAKFEDHHDWLYAVAFSPDGRRFLSAGGGSPDDWKGKKTDADRVIRYWGIDSREVLHRFEGHEGAVRCLVALPDGKQFISGSADMTLRLWRLPD